jgi:serine/threonine protein kinase
MDVFKTNKIDIYRIESSYSLYEVFKSNVLGRGTHSMVYLGRCISSKNPSINNYMQSNKLVAVKKIMMNDMQYKFQSQLTEIEIMKNIMEYDHPNIIKCYDIIEDINVVYIIMEYCDSGDLSSLLINKPMNEEYIKYYFRQIIDALKFLHGKNIIHRDIKPKNILLSNNKKIIKICDFGFAKQTNDNSLKRASTFCGSPLYMAPEIYQQNGYTDSVDIWSLGIILYEMIFGIHPLSTHNDINILAKSIIHKEIIIHESPNNSSKCINLLKKMLKLTEQERITIEELFGDKWIYTINDKEIFKTSMYNDDNIKNNNCNNKNNNIIIDNLGIDDIFGFE